MKSLPKVNPDDSLVSWNPPDLNIESSTQPQSSNKEQVLAIFKKDDEPNADQKGKETKKQLHSKANGKSFSSWQPGLLDQQAAGINEEDWAFLDVSDTPFDRSWKVQSPNGFSDGIGPRENEIAKLLERARLQAEEIILAAQAEADDILLQAQSEIDVQKKEGFEQGQKEARAEIEDAVKAVRKMAEEIEAWKTDLMSHSEHILVEMLKDIARKMFVDGVKLDAHALHTNLNRIM